MSADGASSLWRDRDFMLMWSGQSVSLIGSQVTVIALPLIAIRVFSASTFEIGLLTTFSSLPWLIFSLPAGVLVDRSRKRRVMLLCDLARALVLGSVPIAAWLGLLTLGQLYAVASVSGALAVLFSSAYLSFPPTLLAKDQLVDANGKISSTNALASVTGPSVTGFLVALIGAAQAVTADGISYLISSLSLLAIRHAEPLPTPGPADKRGFRREVSAGLRIMFDDRILALITISNSLGNFILAAFNTIWLVYAIRKLGWSVQALGLVMGLSSIGGLIGSLAAKYVIKRSGLARVLLFSQIPCAPGAIIAGLVAPGFAGQVAVTMGLMVTLTSAVVYNVAQRSYRFATCPAGILGRLNATANWMQWSLRPAAGLLSGALAMWIGLRPCILICACLFPLCPALLWISPLRGRSAPSVVLRGRD
jgi:Na+/melibiose symporter-like transporter